MTSAQLEGLLRAIMGILAGYALSVGIDDQTWLLITGGVVGIGTAVWSWYSHSQKKAIAEVAKDPEVATIVVDSKELADAIPNEKVVSAHDTIADIGTR